MDKKTAEVLYLVSEYVGEIGQWFSLCEFLEKKDISPEQIADAVNKVAKIAGCSSGLTADDCR